MLINPEISRQILPLQHHLHPFPTTALWHFQTAQAMQLSHIHTNPSFQTTQSISDLLPKGHSEDEEHLQYLAHDEGNDCKALLG